MKKTIGEVIGIPVNLIASSKGELLDDEICLGVEMELEGGDSSSHGIVPEGWSIVSDGTLRNNGRELIFSSPKAGAHAIKCINSFYSSIDFNELDCSELCSTHVHFDLRWGTLKQAAAVAAIAAIEDIDLFRITDSNDRIGNPYCNTAYNNYGFWGQVRTLWKGNLPRGKGSPRKYSSINLDSLSRFGSIELRHSNVIENKSILLLYINKMLGIISHVRMCPMKNKAQLLKCVSSYEHEKTQTILRLLKGLV